MPSRGPTLALSLLATTPLATACEPSPTTTTTTPPELTDAPVLIEWFLDEQVRGSKTSNKGASLGILTRDLKGVAEGTWNPRPHSCKEGLTSFIPLDEYSEVLLGIDEQGLLYRYAGEGWSPVPSTTPLPPIGHLLGVAPFSFYVEILVTFEIDNRQEPALLSYSDGRIVYRRLPEAGRLGKEREDSLRSFRSARCTDAVRNCLHLTDVDEAIALMLEPELYENRTELAMLKKDQVRDVRYADPEGTMLAVLSTEHCPQPEQPDPSSGPSGGADAEEAENPTEPAEPEMPTDAEPTKATEPTKPSIQPKALP